LLKKVQRLLLCLLANDGAFSALPKGCHDCGRDFRRLLGLGGRSEGEQICGRFIFD